MDIPKVTKVSFRGAQRTKGRINLLSTLLDEISINPWLQRRPSGHIFHGAGFMLTPPNPRPKVPLQFALSY